MTGEPTQPQPLASAAWTSVIALFLATPVYCQCQYEVTIIDGPIDCFGSPTSISAGHLNDGGGIVGYYKKCSGGDEGFSWTQARGLEILLRPDGFTFARGHGTNNLNDTVGWIAPEGPGLPHAAFWQNDDGVVQLGVPLLRRVLYETSHVALIQALPPSLPAHA